MGSVCDLAIGLRKSKVMSRLSYAQKKSLYLESGLCRTIFAGQNSILCPCKAASGKKLIQVREALGQQHEGKTVVYLFPENHQQPS